MNILKYNLAIEFDMPFLGTMDLGSDTDGRFTGFERDASGTPLLQAYQLLGFLKEAASTLGEALATYNLRRRVESLVFVEPKLIPLEMPIGGEVFIRYRHKRVHLSPTKVKTVPMQSEAVPAGTRVECVLIVYPGLDEVVLRELLDYGAYRGMGQWRSAEYGTFGYCLTSLSQEEKPCTNQS